MAVETLEQFRADAHGLDVKPIILVAKRASDGEIVVAETDDSGRIPVLADLDKTGLATEAKQDNIISELQTLNGVDFATSEKQDTIIAGLASIDATDFATETTLNTLSLVVSTRLGGSFTPFPYDHMSFDGSGADSDVYAFYLGGSGGTLKGTVTIQYTDSTKETILNVTTVAGP